MNQSPFKRLIPLKRSGSNRMVLATVFCLGSGGLAVQAETISDLHAGAKRLIVEKAKIRSRALLQLSETHGFDLSSNGRSRRETGTAFCWTSNGGVLTAEHVVGAARDIRLADGPKLMVEKRWVNWDVALLKGPPCQPIRRRTGDVDIGEPLVLAGFSPNGDWQMIDGVLNEKEKPRSIGYGWSPPLIAIKAKVGPGFSGGMVLDEQGRLVGMIQAAEPGRFAYAITTDRLLSVLDNSFARFGLSLSNGRIVDMDPQKKQTIAIPSTLIAVERFGKEWTDPRPAFSGGMIGEQVRLKTVDGTMVLSASIKPIKPLKLSVAEKGWNVESPGPLLSQMGLLSGDIIIKVSGADAQGQPPSNIEGMLVIRRGKQQFSLLAP